MKVVKYSNIYKEEVINLKLKQEDVNEVINITGENVKNSLKSIVDNSNEYIFLIIFEGKVSGIFGVEPETDKIGVGMFLTDGNIAKYKRQLIKQTKETINKYLEKYDIIYNYCPSSYKTSLNWLVKQCGAELEDNEYIFNGERFKKFYIKKRK